MTDETILKTLENCEGGWYCDDCVLANEHCIRLAVSMIHKLERENKQTARLRAAEAQMTVGQTIRARFRTVPDQCAGENASWEKRFPLRDAVVAYIHPAGRYVTLETILDGKAVKESFHPNDLKERKRK